MPFASRPSALILTGLALLLGAPATAQGLGTPLADQQERARERPYIVMLTDAAATEGVLRAERFSISRVDPGGVDRRVAALEARVGIRPTHVYTAALPGFAARLTPDQVDLLRADPSVEAVVPDLPIHIAGAGAGPGRRRQEVEAAAGSVITTKLASGPTIPTGIRRIGATGSPTARIDGVDQRVDADVAVLDTGIAASHPDLVVAGGHDCTGGPASGWADRHGHGTHVAGTIAAKDNGRGVVGVAPGARVWAVRVLDANGKGLTSWLVCGLDYVAGRTREDGSPFFAVANMSISGPFDAEGPCGDTRSPYQAATCRVVAHGVPVVVAAGNDSRDARYFRPGAYDNVITVSALADFDGQPGGDGQQSDVCPFYSVDSDDSFADFSNFGPDVDLIAPGKCILSTYPSDRYAWMSGTSMATPHVSGAVVLYRTEHPDAQPLQIKQALQAAGRLDWRTVTDPDGVPELLLHVDAFGPPPSFAISVAEPVDFLGRGLLLKVPVKSGRRDGHREPIRLVTGDLPGGVQALPSTIRDKSGWLRLRSSGSVKTGRHEVRVRGTDSEIGSAATFTLRIDAEVPQARFVTPESGHHNVTRATSQELAWSYSDEGGSGLAGHEVQHQMAQVVEPGSCGGTSWEDVDAPMTGGPPQTVGGLVSGRCHRWRLVVRDGARNPGVAISGTRLIDDEAPPAPTLIASGAHVYQADPGAQTWFRSSGDGGLQLRVRSVDPHAGTRSIRVDDLVAASGWVAREATTHDGPQAQLSLDWRKGASAASIRARATDAVDLVGPWATLDLLPDDTSPTGARFLSPAPGTFAYAGAQVAITFDVGDDTGSGVDTLATLTRLRADAGADGTCDGVDFSVDGPARERPSGTTETGLASGTCYRWTLVAHDRVDNAGPSRSSGVVLVDGQPPTIEIESPPADGPLFDIDGDIDVRYSVSDRGGSGLASHGVVRQSAAVADPGTCDGVSWQTEIAAAATGGLDERDLRTDRCYRWVVTAVDRAGNERVVRSRPVLVDRSEPARPRIVVAGGGAWSEGPQGPVWFRAGVRDSFRLRAEVAQDAGSGIRGSRFGPLSPSAGWANGLDEAIVAAGRQGERRFGYGPSATDAAFELEAIDRAGNHSPTVEITLRADRRAPEVGFESPSGPTTRLDGDSVALDFTARDTGAGIARRTVQRQRALVEGDADCRDRRWTDDGAARPATDGMVVSGLEPGWCYRWRLVAEDRVGHGSGALSGPVRLEKQARLDVEDVTARLLNGDVTRSGATTIRLEWLLSTNLPKETVGFDVHVSRDGGRSWQPARGGGGSAPQADVTLAPGREVVFAVRARDAFGRRSAWQETGRLRLKVIDDDAASLDDRSGWSTIREAGAVGGTQLRGHDGALLDLQTDGQAALVTDLGPGRAAIVMRVDGEAAGTVDLHRGELSRRFAVRLTPRGQHDLRLRVEGDGSVVVDAFLILIEKPSSIQH